MVNELVVFIGLILAGFAVGRILELVADKLEVTRDKKGKKTGDVIFFGETFYSFLVETLYFAALFSIPMSGNVSIFILVAGLLLYSLYGKFGTERLKPGKPEDEVHTKWFTGYP